MIRSAVAILFWLVVWFCAALALDNDILLAGPAQTLEALWANLASADFWMIVAESSVRIVGCAAIFSLLGMLLGLVASYSEWVRSLLAPLIQVMKSVPVVCVVVILLVTIGPQGAVAVTIAFVALPPFYVVMLSAVEQGVSDTARTLRLMGASASQVFFAFTWPALLPGLKDAAQTSMALSWRAGVMGELLGLPLGSIGTALYVSKLTLDTSGLLAWTIIVMLLAWICERAFVWLLGLTAASPRLAVRRIRGLEKFDKTTSEGAVPSDVVLEGVALKNVVKSFGDKVVLEAFDLELGSGERICLMAPTGSGKTTALRIALGLERADGGAVFASECCGVVLQQSTLIPSLSAFDNVLLVCDQARSQDTIAIDLDTLLPAGMLNKRADELSGGTKRLTEIARALFSPGSAIVLDEPFVGLDPEAKARACQFIKEHLHGRALIIATHDATDAELLDAQIVRL